MVVRKSPLIIQTSEGEGNYEKQKFIAEFS